MALWGKKDVSNDKPKFVTLEEREGKLVLAQDNSGKQLVLIDNVEASVEANKLKGITSPGWYLIQKTGDRVKVELLIALADVPRTVSGVVKDESDATETDLGVGADS